MLETHYSCDTGYLHEDKNLLPDLIDPGRYTYRDYREGLARWRKKYPQLTGLKEVEDVLDNVEARNAWAGRKPLYQEELTEADKRLAEDIEAWEKVIDEFLQREEERKQGKKIKEERKQIQVLSKTPLVLTLLGANKDLSVATTTGKLKKILVEKHKLPVEVIKQVPKALTDPVMIFESATVKGDYIVMLGLKDEVGATVIVPVSLDYDGIGGYQINYVPSIYSQKDTETNTPRNYWFIKQIEE